MNKTPLPEDIFPNHLTLDDSFQFRCKQCGQCCKHREDILVSPHDLFRLAQHLSLTPEQVIEQYCIPYIGETSRLPVVILKAVGTEKVCPFLHENCCSVHAAKPTVCALFPLGRAAQLDEARAPEILYFFNEPPCDARDEKHTVRQWLEDFGLTDSGVWFLAWQKALAYLIPTVCAAEEKTPEQGIALIRNFLFYLLYLDYDVAGDFLPQFVRNTEKARQFMDQVNAALHAKGNQP